jgi:hypothetical protein
MEKAQMSWYDNLLVQIGLQGRTRMTAAGPRSAARDVEIEGTTPNRSAKRKARDRARAKAAKQARKRNR